MSWCPHLARIAVIPCSSPKAAVNPRGSQDIDVIPRGFPYTAVVRPPLEVLRVTDLDSSIAETSKQ